MNQTIQTRWYIRTQIANYYAVQDTELPDTFIATPAIPHNGVYDEPKAVTFRCEYVLEECHREIPVRLPKVLSVSPVFILQRQPA